MPSLSKFIIMLPLEEIIVMKRYLCVICGLIYDEAKGWPEENIAPGTRWEDVPDDWFCPDCGANKTMFSMVEIN